MTVPPDTRLVKPVSAVVVALGIFWILTALGPLWLLWLSGRRLAMSDDYAAISSAALVALLLLLFIELHLIMKEGADGLTSLRQGRHERWSKALAEGELSRSEVQMMWDELQSSETKLVTRARFTLVGLLTAVLLSGTLVLVCLWAAVDGHGPARWLAWLSWLCICWAFALVLTIGVVKASREYVRAAAERSAIELDDLLSRYATRQERNRVRRQRSSNDAPPLPSTTEEPSAEA
ncbi:hypothetical protein [Streptomyces pseudogriseolus]|uniref:hypothetical protein n=1 Tax=Streptomyces pseudogriseolus TaxID=36817 RepID=UPI003FA2296A